MILRNKLKPEKKSIKQINLHAKNISRMTNKYSKQLEFPTRSPSLTYF